ncbi:hypothetical protein [Natronogracilivirga saccharolytica]|uniref:Uncharacterized protein n=1 Tax=Natronogracilivirga saccharolytica TaxID=2812953 RepID=A0A8J7RL91_9BACT|nr:hypothetical protein [Natronogracilivirga saccharolytica]MBP3193387.1 hypothetical protein [Natronogracilivirga saccharolytica]
MVLLPAISIARFAGGSGTEQDPYQIETRDQLQAMADSANLDRHFIHIADIDASDTGNWNESKGFEPIGTYGENFCSTCFGGSFDASGLSSGVFIYRIEAGAYVISRKMMFVK